MFYDDRLAIGTLVWFFLYVGFLILVVRRYLQPFSFKVLLVLTPLGTSVMLISQIPWEDAGEWTPFWDWFQSLNGEYNLLATFSAALLVSGGVVGSVIGLWATRLTWWVRLYWAVVGGLFFVMGADEYSVLHEGHEWMLMYGAVGSGLALSGFAVFWYGLARESLSVFVFLFGGLGLMSVGGAVFENLAARQCVDLPSWLHICRQLPYLEEALEILGTSLIVAGLLSFAQERITSRAWSRARLAVVGGSALGAAVLLLSFWVLPGVEARYFAEDVEIRYFDEHLALVGYKIPDHAFRPGETVDVAFFWKADDWIPVNFNMSAQLLTVPDAELVVSHSVLIIDPVPSAWLPGLTTRWTADLTIPDDVAAPASLVVSVPLWVGVEQRAARDAAIQSVPIDRSSVPLFDDHLPHLKHITVLPDHDPPEPPVAANVQFADGFRLAGYALPPEASDSLEVAFWWTCSDDLDTHLTQIFHLHEVNGDGVFILDQPPFGGRFLTKDWVDGMRVMDSWTLALPDAMPPGTYRVVTGMYEATTLDRARITDGHGMLVHDNLIELGPFEKTN